MKEKAINGMTGLAAGALSAAFLTTIGAAKVCAMSYSPPAGKVLMLPEGATGAGTNWTVIIIASILALAIIVALVVLLLRGRSRSRKRPSSLGMPPTMPPPAQAPTSPYAAATPQQPAQPGTPSAARLILPDNSQIPLPAGLKSIGRADFERVVPPDSAKYISREHFVVGFAYGNYYIQDAGSANGTKLNGREIKGAGSQWLNDGDQINLAGVVTVVFRSA